MTLGEEIVSLDEIALTLHAIASGAVTLDPDAIDRMACRLELAADRAQEVADLRAAFALVSHEVGHGPPSAVPAPHD